MKHKRIISNKLSLSLSSLVNLLYSGQRLPTNYQTQLYALICWTDIFWCQSVRYLLLTSRMNRRAEFASRILIGRLCLFSYWIRLARIRRLSGISGSSSSPCKCKRSRIDKPTDRANNLLKQIINCTSARGVYLAKIFTLLIVISGFRLQPATTQEPVWVWVDSFHQVELLILR